MVPKAKTTVKPTAQPLILHFNFERETPGTLRFQEDKPEGGSRPAIGTLYITKKALSDANLGQITALTVTVEAAG